MRVLIVEDDENRMVGFNKIFADDEVHWAKNAYAGIRALKKGEYDLVMLDHDLADEHYGDLNAAAESGKGTGQEVAQHMATMENPPPFAFVHSWNPAGAMAIELILATAGINTFRSPFGSADLKRGIVQYRELFEA